ncbi:hypothetical protein BDW74DRAFT_158851 [Aspergillus multicolor]|uniref:uncharacterized protein n=1 Tax=Aspergillus multicolor TaxID=41759 RepID=UPI003CCCEC38
MNDVGEHRHPGWETGPDDERLITYALKSVAENNSVNVAENLFSQPLPSAYNPYATFREDFAPHSSLNDVPSVAVAEGLPEVPTVHVSRDSSFSMTVQVNDKQHLLSIIGWRSSGPKSRSHFICRGDTSKVFEVGAMLSPGAGYVRRKHIKLGDTDQPWLF